MSDVEVFVDDTSLFSIVNYSKASTLVLTSDLLKIQDWSYKWKMSFDPGQAKPAQELLLTRRTNKIVNPLLYFNNATHTYTHTYKLTHTQKDLGLQLDNKLLFSEHTNNKTSKATKGIGLLHKLRPILPCRSVLTIYKSFIRPHLDSGDVIYDQLSNRSFPNMIESVQYNAALAITGSLELEFEHLQ